MWGHVQKVARGQINKYQTVTCTQITGQGFMNVLFSQALSKQAGWFYERKNIEKTLSRIYSTPYSVPFQGGSNIWCLDDDGSKKPGYNIGPGRMYPLLNKMENSDLLNREKKIINGKVRLYDSITPLGLNVFNEAKEKAVELFHEIKE